MPDIITWERFINRALLIVRCTNVTPPLFTTLNNGRERKREKRTKPTPANSELIFAIKATLHNDEMRAFSSYFTLIIIVICVRACVGFSIRCNLPNCPLASVGRVNIGQRSRRFILIPRMMLPRGFFTLNRKK